MVWKGLAEFGYGRNRNSLVFPMEGRRLTGDIYLPAAEASALVLTLALVLKILAVGSDHMFYRNCRMLVLCSHKDDMEGGGKVATKGIRDAIAKPIGTSLYYA